MGIARMIKRLLRRIHARPALCAAAGWHLAALCLAGLSILGRGWLAASVQADLRSPLWAGFDNVGVVVGACSDPILALEVADLDGDGDLDLVGAEASGNIAAWQNRGAPFGQTWTQHAVGRASRPTRLASADLDADGHPDLIVASQGGLTLWRNGGSPFAGGWSAWQVGDRPIASLAVADMDGDGRLDLITGGGVPRREEPDEDNRVTVWYAPAAPFAQSWQAQDVASAYYTPNGLDVGDLDGDGDLDIVIGTNHAPPVGDAAHPVPREQWPDVYQLRAFRNDGGGRWTEFNVGRDPEIETLAFVAYHGFWGATVTHVRLVDLDRDGDLDILATEGVEGDFLVMGWRNDGTPFSGELWQPSAIAKGEVHNWLEDDVLWAEAGDIDLDGDLDVASGSMTDLEPWPLNLWENTGISFGAVISETHWLRHKVTARREHVRAGRLADLDADGDLDLVTACDPLSVGDLRKLRIWENAAFRLSVAPPAQRAAPDEAATYAASAEAWRGLAEPIRLWVSGLPAGMEVGWQRNPLPPGGDTTLTLLVPADGIRRSYPMELVGIAGRWVRSTPFTLTVGGPERYTHLPLMLRGATGRPQPSFAEVLRRSAAPRQATGASATWHVDGRCAPCGEGTPERPFRTIAAALNAAHAGDEIRIAQGVYTENLGIDTPLALMGGYQAGTWARDPARYETVIVSQDTTIPGDWDGDWLGPRSVVRDAYAYRMWYSAGNKVDGERIGYADSPDGVNWFQPHRSPLLGPGAVDAWDEAGVAAPAVLSTTDGFRMWYVGWNALGQRAIGLATSTDGLTWQKYEGNPVLRPDADDASDFGFPTVVREAGGGYRMWYSGERCIWLATSPDGLRWTKHLDRPALCPGSSGVWDDVRVYAPAVVGGPGRYEMWYLGDIGTEGGMYIGYAWSSDGLTWTKSPANPVLIGQRGNWEGGAIAYPTVIAEGPAQYTLWYRGEGLGRHAIGRATSPDGIHWSKYEDNPVLVGGKPTHWGRPVISCGPSGRGSVLDGLTVRGGDAEYGGGIFADATSLVIRACRVTDNRARRDGGGLWLGNGTYRLEGTVVSRNAAGGRGGGILASYASLAVQGGAIADNAAGYHGGGLMALGSARSALSTTAFARNAARRGGGLYVEDDVEMNIADSAIEDNSARQAGGLRVAYATLNMTNTFVLRNEATAGGPGSADLWYASAQLVNVTFADNRATNGHGGIAFGTGDPAQRLTIVNSILFFNGGELACSGGVCGVTYSDVSQSLAGAGNISADPRFADRAAGNYRLSAGSPAIDAGTDEGAPPFDFEGDPRPRGRVDMGADEFVGS